VDDDTDLRSLVCDSILDVDADALVVQSADGADALLRASRQRFDLLITDLKMPRKDGYSLLTSLERLPRALQPGHVLVFSAHKDSRSATITRTQGSLAWLQKPCTSEELQGQIEVALPRKPRTEQPTVTPQSLLAGLVKTLGTNTLGILSELGLEGVRQESPCILSPGERLGSGMACAPLQFGQFTGEMGLSLDGTLIARLLGAPTPKISATTPSQLIQEVASRILQVSGIQIDPSVGLSDSSQFEGGPRVAIPFSTTAGKAWLLPAIRIAA
jgi:CheY-like chemotaxis protein